MQQDDVTVTAATENSAFLRGVQSKSHVVFRVKTGTLQEEAKKRAPIELAIVLDRSGSMSGEKLEQSKQSIKGIIDKLEPTDALHVIVYDDKVAVTFMNGDLSTKESRETLKRQVDQIRTDGSTCISGGLVAGALALGCQPKGELFRKNAAGDMSFLADVPRKEGEAKVKRIFLFSDGEANRGLKTMEELAQLAADIVEQGASTSSFGIGRDFHEDIMSSIARRGQGFFTYIKKANLIEQYVDEALSNLQALFGTQAKLSLRGRGCAVLTRIYNHEGSVADIKDMRANNLINVVAEITCTPSDVFPATPEDSIVDWELTYIDAFSGQQRLLSGSVKGVFTTDAAVAAQQDKDVLGTVIQLQTGEMDNDVIKLIDSGRRDEAVALKKKIVALLEKAVELNPNGFAPMMLQAAQKTLKQLESNRSDKKVRKAAQYAGYLQRQNSVSSLNKIAGYVVEEDSSSEEDTSGNANSFAGQTSPPRQRRSSITKY